MVLFNVALRGAATLKARGLKEVWNIAAVTPVEKGNAVGGSSSSSNGSFSGELLVPEENFLGICSRELLARGCELLKRTRKGTISFFVFHVWLPRKSFGYMLDNAIVLDNVGDLHWKIVSVYINRMGQVSLISLLII